MADSVNYIVSWEWLSSVDSQVERVTAQCAEC